jgi:hypothetical protein
MLRVLLNREYLKWGIVFLIGTFAIWFMDGQLWADALVLSAIAVFLWKTKPEKESTVQPLSIVTAMMHSNNQQIEQFIQSIGDLIFILSPEFEIQKVNLF